MANKIETDEQWLNEEETEHKLFINGEVPHDNAAQEITEEQWFEVPGLPLNEHHGTGDASFEEDSDDGITVSISNIDVNPTTFNMKKQTGNINGIPVKESNLNNAEDKPWLKPGANIRDYFNFGLNEDTWTAYCNRQNGMRNNDSTSSSLQLKISHLATPITNVNSSVPIGVVGNDRNNGFPIIPDMSMPPPMTNQGGFRSEYSFNPETEPSCSGNSKPVQVENSWDTSHQPIVNQSNSDMRSPRKFRKSDSKERDATKRRERSRDRDGRKFFQRSDRSRSRSHSQKRNSKDDRVENERKARFDRDRKIFQRSDRSRSRSQSQRDRDENERKARFDRDRKIFQRSNRSRSRSQSQRRNSKDRDENKRKARFDRYRDTVQRSDRSRSRSQSRRRNSKDRGENNRKARFNRDREIFQRSDRSRSRSQRHRSPSDNRRDGFRYSRGSRRGRY